MNMRDRIVAAEKLNAAWRGDILEAIEQHTIRPWHTRALGSANVLGLFDIEGDPMIGVELEHGEHAELVFVTWLNGWRLSYVKAGRVPADAYHGDPKGDPDLARNGDRSHARGPAAERREKTIGS